jgi:hypothetical protein
MRGRRCQRRPTGPAACLRSRGRPDLTCDVCGQRALDGVIHIPMRIRGHHCSLHCPACHPQRKTAARAAAEAQGVLL